MSASKRLLFLLWSASLLAAGDAARRTYKTYAEPGCTGAVTEGTYDVASAQGSTTCFNTPGSAYSTIDQWCDEFGSRYHQAVFSGTTCDGASTQQSFPLSQCANSVSGSADAQGTVIVTCDFSSSQPCFGRDTRARLESGDTIRMTSLRSGDRVYDGPSSITRVIVNQHKEAALLSSPLLQLVHDHGSISLTPDHVVQVNGSFVPAREARVGSTLGGFEGSSSEVVPSTISHIRCASGGIINPLTTSGKIMADGVLASTYPEWIAGYMLGRSTASLSSLLSFLFPATTQAYYDAHLEPFFQSSSPSLVQLKRLLPEPLVPLTVVVADVLISAGFVAFSLSSSKVLAGLVALVVIVALKVAQK